jgi:L-lactate dehydrogenase complex protein LldF
MAGRTDQELILMSTQQQVDPAANAALFILQDNIHEPMHDRFVWGIRERRDKLARAIPEWGRTS